MTSDTSAAHALAGLKRFFDRTPARGDRNQRDLEEPDVERCDFCDVEIAGDHGHVVNVSSRSMLCVCRACALLFAHERAAGGRYRAVPDRYLSLGADVDWESLQIPVGIAFILFNSALGRVAAFYPSPAGATESLLPLDAWTELVRAHPFLQQLTPDVEALLVRRTHDRHESFIVPIDACYELVGGIRRHWRGFDGGDDARNEIERFFARVRERSRPQASTAAPA
jgi:uncharacterized protein DUF5947